MPRRQILSLYIGQSGVQLGNAIWELLSLEHGIKVDASLSSEHIEYGGDKSIKSFFYFLKCQNGKCLPRCIFLDTESMVIDEVRTGSYKDFFPHYSLISGDEDAANLYPRGYNISCKTLWIPTVQTLRRLWESSDYINDIMVFRSCCGGTGSGGTALFLREIKKEFSKINVSEFAIIPSPCISISIVEPYNTILTLFQTMRTATLTIALDNEALYGISKSNLHIKCPSYFNINKIIAQGFSSVTASSRFDSVRSSDFEMYHTNLIPFPKLKYLIISYAPILPSSMKYVEPCDIHSLTEEVFKREHFMVKCFPEHGEHMTSAILYRGRNCEPISISQAIAQIKADAHTKFVDWCPTGFKVGITRQPPPYVEYSCLGKLERSACLLTNSTCISQILDYIIQKFDILFNTKAYVHWFTGEGLEEAEFVEAREGVLGVLMDYLKCMGEEQK